MSAGQPQIDIQRPAGPVANAYEQSRAELAVIVGPTGGGKTVASAKRCLRVAQWQKPSPRDGIRKARVICVTPTYRMAWGSVIPSFQHVMSPYLRVKGCATFTGSKGDPATFTLHANVPGLGPIHLEVQFLAVGDENLEEFMRGRETTAWWIPEMDTQPEDLIGLAANRAGRYPPPSDRPEADDEPAYKGVFGDANVPDIDSWFFDRFWIPGNEKPGQAIYRQPPGDDPAAENMENLRKIDPNYYANMAARMEPWAVRRFIRMRPGYSRFGKPVHPDFDEARHVSATELPVNSHLPVGIGVDGGGNTLMPGAVFGQQHYVGSWALHACLAPTDQTTADELGEQITRTLNKRYKRAAGAYIVIDPAALVKSPLSPFTYAQQLQAKTGIEVFPAPSNAPNARRSPLAKVFRSFPAGKPAIVLDGVHCGPLIRAYAGGFSYPSKGVKEGKARADQEPAQPRRGERRIPDPVRRRRGGRLRSRQLHRPRRVRWRPGLPGAHPVSFLVPKTPTTPAQTAAQTPVAPVDQADVANRQAMARTRRLAGGGSASTVLGSAMAARATAASPRQALTGIGA